MARPSFYITGGSPYARSFWEPCTAKTLLGAKMQCTRAFSHGLRSDFLRVAFMSEGGPLRELSYKLNNDYSLWEDNTENLLLMSKEAE